MLERKVFILFIIEALLIIASRLQRFILLFIF